MYRATTLPITKAPVVVQSDIAWMVITMADLLFGTVHLYLAG